MQTLLILMFPAWPWWTRSLLYRKCGSPFHEYCINPLSMNQNKHTWEMKGEESVTWLTHYPAECCIPGGWFLQSFNPTVEGVWDPALPVIQFCLDGQLRGSRAPRRPNLRRKGQGNVNLGGWLAAWGRYNNFLRLASYQASNELELFDLHQNNLFCQLGLMTNFPWYFIQHLLWSPVRFQLQRKNMYIKIIF